MLVRNARIRMTTIENTAKKQIKFKSRDFYNINKDNSTIEK